MFCPNVVCITANSNCKKDCIASLLADREFVGKAWFGWLLQEQINFHIRLKNNVLATNSRGKKVNMRALFRGLLAAEQRIIEGKRVVWGHSVYLAGLRLSDGQLLIVATSMPAETAIKTYALRGEIETLFGCLKGRGFNFEDTYMTDAERIKKLFALLAIAFCWSHKTGQWRHEEKPIKIKKHGRPAISLFR